MRRALRPLIPALIALALYLGLPRADLTDIYPREGIVRPGEIAHLVIELHRPWYDRRPVTVTVTRGLDPEPVATLRTTGPLLEWRPTEPGGYGVTATLGQQRRESALDVGTNWAERPRYGFLTDFGPQHADTEQRFAQMARFHLNGLQFYDWHYRHTDYLPPAEEYRDPLGRLLSRSVLLQRIAGAHDHGMAAMAYTTVYAAPGDYYQAHPEQVLRDNTGRVLRFGEDFLYIMNPERGGPFAQQMLDQYQQILTDLPFDGIHLDQFGSPRIGYRADGSMVDIATAMTELIDDAKQRVAPHPVFFNDVGGWPLKDTAPTTKDAVYIEVWPPHVTFQHLHELIGEGRRRSGGKPVILAAYISSAYGPSVLLTDAVIFASGGYHLEIGEGYGLLSDPYFPKYRQMDAELVAHLRRYYDVAVRYQELFYRPTLTDWDPETTVGESRILPGGYFNGVWPLGRQDGDRQILHLINLNGLEDANWNGVRTDPPTLLSGSEVRVTMAEPPRAVTLIDPDGPDQSPIPTPFRYENGQVILHLERLAYWSILVFEH